MKLTRENLLSGQIRQQIIESGVDIDILSESELNASRKAALASINASEDLWLFSYGSLMWNPAFNFSERCIGYVHGYHRRFCLWTNLGRGSPDRPGLLLGLERGGSCKGILYRIPAAAVEEETTIVWAREMITGAYIPTWIQVRTNGHQETALTFAMNRDCKRYTGRLSNSQIAKTIATAEGSIGTCADYLLNTLTHLDELGIPDRVLSNIGKQVVSLMTNDTAP
tara:strand:- start:367 stop:1041 length:675 start_codon:yes stop_codon:yes gene_type:complete